MDRTPLMGSNRRVQERELAAAALAAETKCAEAERRAVVDAQKVLRFGKRGRPARRMIATNSSDEPAASRVIEG
jgi:hypothetical protein